MHLLELSLKSFKFFSVQVILCLFKHEIFIIEGVGVPKNLGVGSFAKRFFGSKNLLFHMRDFYAVYFPILIYLTAGDIFCLIQLVAIGL